MLIVLECSITVKRIKMKIEIRHFQLQSAVEIQPRTNLDLQNNGRHVINSVYEIKRIFADMSAHTSTELSADISTDLFANKPCMIKPGIFIHITTYNSFMIPRNCITMILILMCEICPSSHSSFPTNVTRE